MPDGPGGFAQDSTCPALLRIPLSHISIHIRNCHPLWLNFPDHSILDLSTKTRSYNPGRASPHNRFGLFPGRSPLLGESLLFSLPAGTKMFQFPAFASVQTVRIAALQAAGFPIRRSPGHRSCAPNRGLSQLVTSFIASVSQGIRHAPLTTFANVPPAFNRQSPIELTASLILSAVDSLSNLQSCLCQHVKDHRERTGRPESRKTEDLSPSIP